MYWKSALFFIVGLIFLAYHLSAHEKVILKGSTTVEPIARSFLEYYKQIDHDFEYEANFQGSTFGAKSLINGTCNLACMSRFMTDDEFKEAVANNVTPVFHNLVRDGIALVVNEKNKVESLTIEQIRNIYIGNINNWKDVGGKDAKIVVITRSKTSGTREVFDQLIMSGNEEPTYNFEVTGNKDIEVLVQKNPNAIGYVGLGFLEGVKTIKVNGIKPSFETINDDIYPLTRPLFFITNGYPKKGTAIYDLVSMSKSPIGTELVKKLGWYGPKVPSFSMLIEEFIIGYWEFGLLFLIIILILSASTVLVGRLNIKLNKMVKKRDKEINDRVFAENALKENEENIRITLYSIGDGFISTDIEGNIINMNPVAESLTEWKLYEAKGRKLEDVLLIMSETNGESFQRDENPITPIQLQIDKKPNGYQSKNHYILTSRSGRKYYISYTSSPVKDPNGFDKGIVITFKDITEQYEKDRLLKESEVRYRNFLENFLGIAYQSDTESFHILLFHGAVLEITGYSTESFISGEVSWGEIVHPNDIRFVLEQRDILLNTDNYVARNEYRILHKNGDVRWVFDIARRYFVELEDKYIIQGTVYDVTEKKRFEEALTESEQRFRSLVENSPIGIISIDQNGKILHINEKLMDILGLNRNIGIQANNIFENKQFDNFRELVKDCFSNGIAYNNFEEYVGENGKKLYLKYHINPVFNSQNKVKIVIANIEDFTERKKTEVELHRISKLESLGILAGGIAHNMKNILAAISLNVDIIKYQPEAIKDALDRIQRSINQAKALSTRFQTFTKSSEPEKELTDIRRIIMEADSMALSGSNVRSELIFAPDLYNLYVDPKQLNEVFMNLIINAKQAMPNGGKIIFKVRNIILKNGEIGNLKEGNYILVEIMDSGCGISKDNLQLIFDPFFTTKESGNGLGLSSVHYIIKKHNGHINVYSEEDLGTTFKIYLPASNEKKRIEIENQDPLKLGEKDIKILIMDDDDDIVASIKEISKLLNYDFTFTQKGEETIELYRNSMEIQCPYSVVILDLTNKKGMGGQETINSLMSIDPNVKAVVFSGYSNQPIISKYQDYGFVAKLEKPVTLKEFSDTLHSVLNSN
jgi:phosphate binding protein